jgi:hypothetical protein
VDSRREVTPEVERELVPAQVESTADAVPVEADPFAAHRDPMEAYMASAGESGATEEEQVAPPPESVGEEASEEPAADGSEPPSEEPAADSPSTQQEEATAQGDYEPEVGGEG